MIGGSIWVSHKALSFFPQRHRGVDAAGAPRREGTCQHRETGQHQRRPEALQKA